MLLLVLDPDLFHVTVLFVLGEILRVNHSDLLNLNVLVLDLLIAVHETRLTWIEGLDLQISLAKPGKPLFLNNVQSICKGSVAFDSVVLDIFSACLALQIASHRYLLRYSTLRSQTGAFIGHTLVAIAQAFRNLQTSHDIYWPALQSTLNLCVVVAQPLCLGFGKIPFKVLGLDLIELVYSPQGVAALGLRLGPEYFVYLRSQIQFY